MEIINIKVHKNETQYGPIYNATVNLDLGQGMKIWFAVKRMTGSKGTYFLWPQEIYNKELAQSSNYEKGVNKFLFGNKAFGEWIQGAINNQIDIDNGVQQVQQPAQETFPTTEIANPENINIEEIKF